MRIERLHSDAWRRLKSVRLRSLADAPDAFGSTLAEAQDLRESDWRQQLDALATYVAVSDGVDEGLDVGIARGVTDHANPHNAYLVSMWVAPEARGAGAGERLIQAVVHWARAAGHSRLLLDVADANLPAVRLYERMGFSPTGEVGSLPPPRVHIKEHQRALDLLL